MKRELALERLVPGAQGALVVGEPRVDGEIGLGAGLDGMQPEATEVFHGFTGRSHEPRGEARMRRHVEMCLVLCEIELVGGVHGVRVARAPPVMKPWTRSAKIVGLDVETALDLGTHCLIQLAVAGRTFVLDPFYPRCTDRTLVTKAQSPPPGPMASSFSSAMFTLLNRPAVPPLPPNRVKCSKSDMLPLASSSRTTIV